MQQLSGIIEGFYGRQWSLNDRLSYPEFLSGIASNTYIYAPKADTKLRKNWRDSWTLSEFNHLKKLSETCKKEGVFFGVGLSPLGLLDDFCSDNKSALNKKISDIKALEADVVCLLFDDIPGDNSLLAEQQIRICNYVEEKLPSQQLLMCPTYYSSDSVLEVHFGQMPAAYWSDLGEGLSSRWGIFWTGELVVSKTYSIDALYAISAFFKRKPVIWDNYPVNDGRLLWPFLNFETASRLPLLNAGFSVLHNPMNQAWCSKVSLARIKHADEVLFGLDIAPESLLRSLLADSEYFQYHGLDRLSTQKRHTLIQCYAKFDHPMANEVINWLSGAYKFDPDCLT